MALWLLFFCSVLNNTTVTVGDSVGAQASFCVCCCVCYVCVKRLCVYLLAWCALSTLFACSWMRLDVRWWLYRQKAKRHTAKQLTSMKILGVRTWVALLPWVMFHTWGPAADSLNWHFCLSLQNVCVIISVRLFSQLWPTTSCACGRFFSDHGQAIYECEVHRLDHACDVVLDFGLHLRLIMDMMIDAFLRLCKMLVLQTPGLQMKCTE